jgi:hypothetical protein
MSSLFFGFLRGFIDGQLVPFINYYLPQCCPHGGTGVFDIATRIDAFLLVGTRAVVGEAAAFVVHFLLPIILALTRMAFKNVVFLNNSSHSAEVGRRRVKSERKMLT